MYHQFKGPQRDVVHTHSERVRLRDWVLQQCEYPVRLASALKRREKALVIVKLDINKASEHHPHEAMAPALRNNVHSNHAVNIVETHTRMCTQS
jgi:hypothetical protein